MFRKKYRWWVQILFTDHMGLYKVFKKTFKFSAVPVQGMTHSLIGIMDELEATKVSFNQLSGTDFTYHLMMTPLTGSGHAQMWQNLPLEKQKAIENSGWKVEQV